MLDLFQFQILVIICLASIAAVLPGVFLVLRGVALMSDAISHAILPGIALMFLLVQRLDSPLLLVGASLAGIATVGLTELVIHYTRLKKDAAIGLVFPLFFSVGVILISQFARNVHLDIDMVLLGDVAFAPFNRLILFGVDCGPYALWALGFLACSGIVLVYLFFKELTLSIFDGTLALLSGFNPALLYYGLMIFTSITAVTVFDVVGSIVIVALMITPPAVALLMAERMQGVVIVSVVSALASGIIGYCIAHYADVSIAGSIAVANGVIFLSALLFAPRKGIIAVYYARADSQKRFAVQLVNEYRQQKQAPVDVNELCMQFGWDCVFAQSVLEKSSCSQ